MWQATETVHELLKQYPGMVVMSELTADELDALNERRRIRPAPLPRSLGNQRLLKGWVSFLEPNFGPESCNLTGTYSDEYGYSHGLMLARNVIKDFERFRRSVGRSGEPATIGVEYHPSTHRAILHFHALLGGTWTPDELRAAQAEWVRTRGWSVAKRVDDAGGCAAYVCKHLLKQGHGDMLEFMLPPEDCGSRIQRRWSKAGRL